MQKLIWILLFGEPTQYLDAAVDVCTCLFFSLFRDGACSNPTVAFVFFGDFHQRQSLACSRVGSRSLREEVATSAI